MWQLAATTALNAGSKYLGGRSASKAAKREARYKARANRLQFQEQEFRYQRQDALHQGAGRAAVGASNIQFSGSAKRYLNSLKMEQARQKAYREMVHRTEQRAIRKGAQGVDSPYKIQAAGDLIGGAIEGLFNR